MTMDMKNLLCASERSKKAGVDVLPDNISVRFECLNCGFWVILKSSHSKKKYYENMA